MDKHEWPEHIGPELAAALEGRGFEALTPVQEAVLDPALDGRDLRISSKTGSGKTVAIGFALRHALGGGGPRGARALVIVPTRELATQVKDELVWLFDPLGVKVAAVIGGSSVRDERRLLATRPEIVVGTPGRLRDHLERGAFDASGVGVVVLDEADRMLDMGFREELEAILGFTPRERRTHLVSATFPAEVRSLADRVQRDPARVEGSPHGEANLDIEHLVHLVKDDERLAAIVNLVLATTSGPTLVFVRTRADVNDLSAALAKAGFRVGTLSGEMEQRERERTLAAFRRGDAQILVATDVAARGLDVESVGRVVHAEPPSDADAYTHRSGRTGRAGKKGVSSILVSPRGFGRLEQLLRRARVRWTVAPVPTARELREEQAQRLFEELTADDANDAGAADGDAAADEGSRDDETLAVRLEKSGQVRRALVRLLRLARAAGRGGAAPREITALAPQVPRARASSPRATRTPAAGPRTGPRTGPAPGAKRTGPKTRDVRDKRAWRAFRVSWGSTHGADTRRLLAMLCRRGGIESGDVGAIRVHPTWSIAEIAADVADAFAERTAAPDPRDPRVKIRPERG